MTSRGSFSPSQRGILGPGVYEDVPFHLHDFSEISGELIVTEAQITSLSASKITAGTIGAENIIIGAGGTIESANFVAGPAGAGWQLASTLAELVNVTIRGVILITDGTGEVQIDDGDWATNTASVSLNRGYTNAGTIGVHGVNKQMDILAPWDTTVANRASIKLGHDLASLPGHLLLQSGNIGRVDVVSGGSTVTLDDSDGTGTWSFFGHWKVESNDGDITGSLIPSVDSTYHLGSTGQRWSTGWIDELTLTTKLTVSGTVGSALTPTADNTHDLGTSALSWQDVYAFNLRDEAGVLRFDTNVGTRLPDGSVSVPSHAYSSATQTGLYVVGGEQTTAHGGNRGFGFWADTSEARLMGKGDTSYLEYNITADEWKLHINAVDEFILGTADVFIQNVNNDFTGTGDDTVFIDDSNQLHIDTSQRARKADITDATDELASRRLTPVKHRTFREPDSTYRYSLIAEDVAKVDPLLASWRDKKPHNWITRGVVTQLVAKANVAEDERAALRAEVAEVTERLELLEQLVEAA